MADSCVQVVSSWVNEIGLVDGNLFVDFKRRHGGSICCKYPGTDQATFDMMLAWMSKGKYVWEFLYKLKPYQIIKCPCAQILGAVTTPCCTNPTPATLNAHFLNGTSGAAGGYLDQLNGQTFKIQVNADNLTWTTPAGQSYVFGPLTVTLVEWHCDGGDTTWEFSLATNINNYFDGSGGNCNCSTSNFAAAGTLTDGAGASVDWKISI